jgi:hypothetical protein
MNLLAWIHGHPFGDGRAAISFYPGISSAASQQERPIGSVSAEPAGGERAGLCSGIGCCHVPIKICLWITENHGDKRRIGGASLRRGLKGPPMYSERYFFVVGMACLFAILGTALLTF